MPSKSILQTRRNKAVPEPSTFSAYRNGNGGEVFVSSRRSSCLRSSNRSARKSFPSTVNRSNAKKHGGFPRRNSRFLNCGLPRLSREQISPSMTALRFGREPEIDSANAEKEANGWVRERDNLLYAFRVDKVPEISLEIKGITASVASSGCSDAGCVTAVGWFRHEPIVYCRPISRIQSVSSCG